MKILKIPAYYSTPGSPLAGIFIKDQAEILSKQGDQVSIIFPDASLHHWPTLFTGGADVTYTQEDNINLIRSAPFSLPKRNAFFLKYWSRHYGRLFEAYKEHYGFPDILHAHTWWGGFAALQIAQKYTLPLFVTEHSSDFLKEVRFPAWKLKVIREIFDQSVAVIAVSQTLKLHLQSFTQKKIRVIPNVVNTDFFTLPVSFHEPSPKVFSPIRLLAIGDLVPVKRFDLLLHSLALLRAKGYAFQLELIGSGPKLKHLQKLAGILKLDRHVHFVGELSREELLPFYHRADLFLSSSDYETFGLVIAEALSCGLPVIATKSGGPEDFLNAQNSILVPKNNPQQMARAIEQIIQKEKVFNPKFSRQKIIDYCGEVIFANQLSQLYEEASGG